MQEQSLKYKMITGIVWTAFQKGGALIIGFIGNIILARLLSPDDYGCIGLLLIFTSIADILIDGGLGVAFLLRTCLYQSVYFACCFFWHQILVDILISLY